MSGPSRRDLVRALLERHGRTYAGEAGIRVERNTPSPLYRLLCLSVLLSARIRAEVALEAARALDREGWRTPERMARASWAARARVLNRAGYARYDERTSTMLGEGAQLLLDRWHGDLRRLRDEAGRDPAAERRLLQEFKGIGEVGADIFCREAQAAWEELRPFADRRALEAAGHLGLPDEAGALSRLVPEIEITRLVAALVRLSLSKDYDDIESLARGQGRVSRQ